MWPQWSLGKELKERGKAIFTLPESRSTNVPDMRAPGLPQVWWHFTKCQMGWNQTPTNVTSPDRTVSWLAERVIFVHTVVWVSFFFLNCFEVDLFIFGCDLEPDIHTRSKYFKEVHVTKGSANQRAQHRFSWVKLDTGSASGLHISPQGWAKHGASIVFIWEEKTSWISYDLGSELGATTAGILLLDVEGEAQQITGSRPHWTLLSPAAQATQPWAQRSHCPGLGSWRGQRILT